MKINLRSHVPLGHDAASSSNCFPNSPDKIGDLTLRVKISDKNILGHFDI